MVTNLVPDLKYRFFWLAVGYALVALVVVLSVVSNPEIEFDIPNEDKVYHMLAYFTLMAWFSQIYHDRSRRILCAVIFILLGILLEYVQSFEPARFSSYGDVIANTAGVATGYLLNLTRLEHTLVKIEDMIRRSFS